MQGETHGMPAPPSPVEGAPTVGLESQQRPLTWIEGKKHPAIGILLAFTIGIILPGFSYVYLRQYAKFVYFFLIIAANILLFWLPVFGIPIAVAGYIYVASDTAMLCRRTRKGFPITKGESGLLGKWPLLNKFTREPTFATDARNAPEEYKRRIAQIRERRQQRQELEMGAEIPPIDSFSAPSPPVAEA